MSSSTSATRTSVSSAGTPVRPSWKSLQRLGVGVLLFAGITLQALAQGANRLEGITFTTGAGNKVELTLRLSDTAPTPLTFTVDNPARIALDLPDTSVAMSSRRVDVKQGVVDTVNVAEADGRTRVVLNVDNLVPYETRVSGQHDRRIRRRRQHALCQQRRCGFDRRGRGQPDGAFGGAGLRLAQPSTTSTSAAAATAPAASSSSSPMPRCPPTCARKAVASS